MPVISFPFLKPNLPSPISPNTSKKWTKIITAISASIISLSMITFGIVTIVFNDHDFQKSHGVVAPDLLQEQSSGSELSDAALPGNGKAVGTGGSTGTESPQVTLEATPASVKKGEKATLKWKVTNSPTSCEASEDWSGEKDANGSETTASLDKTQTYIFTLTCKNDTGTGFSTVSVGVIEQGGTSVPDAPVVTLSANPTSIYSGDSSTLIWNVTNTPTACTASGDWSGTKSTTGPASTGKLTTAKTYTYTLTCTNESGEGFATTSVKVLEPPADLPVVLLSAKPVGPVAPGATAKITWTTENSPTKCTASGDWSGSKATGGGSQITGALSSVKTYSFKLSCSNSSGTANDTVTILVIPNPPAVSLTLSPSSISAGSSATISWSATNSPTSCSASGNWSGAKNKSGSQSTGTMPTPGTYFYNLSCTNQGGTGYANNVPLTVTTVTPPVVTLSASPIATTVGNSSTLTWSSTGSPTSCSASGDWSGTKNASGSQNSGTLLSVKTYTYTLTCANAGGSSSASTSVGVTSGGGGVVAPVVTISASPTTLGTGSSTTISWSATNNPTSCSASGSWSGTKSASGSQSSGAISSAGSYTYTLACSNSAGSNTKSVTVTVIAVPVVTITASPTTITAGSTHTLAWSATGSPTSCTAGGAWSGSKAATGGPLTIGPITSAGSYLYSLSCTNAGGTGTQSTAVTVNAAAAYCAGLTPCYGPADLATHNTTANCWAYNQSASSSTISVYNITNFNNGFHKSGPGKNLLPNSTTAAAICGNVNLQTFLSGTSLTGVGSHNHQSSTKQNNNSTLTSYRAGYYDASKP